MEQITQKKKSAPKKKGSGNRDDMGNEIPQVARTLENINNALDAAKQQKAKKKDCNCCGCY